MGSTVTGAGGLTKTGGGLLLLQSSANDYSGDTVVAGGTLALGAHNAIPSDGGKGNVVVNGTLDLQGTVQTFNGLSGTGLITNSSGTRAGLFLCAKDVSVVFTFDGYIGGAMNLSKIRANPILVLTQPNTYMGSTTNHDGTLRIGTDNALPPTTFLTIGSGTNDAQFDLAGYNQQIAGLAADTSGVAMITNSADSSDSTLTFSNHVGRSVYKGRIVDRPLRKVSLTVASGTLILNQQLSTYRGLTVVTNSGSELIVWTGPTGAGSFSVANGATLGVTLSAANDTLNMSALTLGSSSTDTETLTINLNSFGRHGNTDYQSEHLRPSNQRAHHGDQSVNSRGRDHQRCWRQGACGTVSTHQTLRRHWWRRIRGLRFGNLAAGSDGGVSEQWREPVGGSEGNRFRGLPRVVGRNESYTGKCLGYWRH
jgi:autotransporter-associated beta strand protein